ncbi:hypothetical protein [Cytobacillus horneckiae]|uniref:Uncharacterized protein n=1 Tax=Cytobacillus horneckiae TaxID=549687 RepID=A0A2N0ZGZ4_9BACI|nr:hypothetical protein [Cytobacillus horneckiae]MED2940692.1 hypothetical protein [Cytobacillus horneckiae]PKG28777.1 hypothetical protein CWS20_11870 [Cytobacillus horneckiae]
MAYKESIAIEIRELFKNAPKGTTEYYLEHFDQQDVRDTANHLHSLHPKSLQDSPFDYTGKATITIMK